MITKKTRAELDEPLDWWGHSELKDGTEKSEQEQKIKASW